MSDSLFALPVKQTLSPSLTLRQQDQLPLVVVDHPQVRRSRYRARILSPGSPPASNRYCG